MKQQRMPGRVRALGVAALALGVVAGPLGAQDAGTPKLGIELENFDRSVRPQDDFYRYVNGTWLRTTPLPEDRSSYGAFSELADQSEAALRAIIEEAAAEAGHAPGSVQQRIADFYRSYMDTARIESRGLEPLRPELERIRALRSVDELAGQFAHLRRIGVTTPISATVWQDTKNADRYIAYLGQSGLGLPDRDYYRNDGERFAEIRESYLGYIATLLELAGEPQPRAAAEAILALETALAEEHWDRARNRDSEATYNYFALSALDSLTSAFAWDEFLAGLGADRSPGVVVRQPDYLQALGGILAGTPVETWRQYLAFKLLDAYADELSRPFVDARFAFRGEVLRGLEENRPRWKRAVDAVDDAVGMDLGRLYVERHFRPEAKARMQELVDNLLAAFREGIDELEWMSEETRARAREKLASFTVKIGYPDEWEDYSGLEVRADDLVGNRMRARRFAFDRMVGRLGQPIDRGLWGMTPQTVNAYYNPTLNEIVFPAAILQPPFFDPEADDAVNYGAIGGVIGHEISHGFDDQGRRFDGTGNLRDWWTEADARAFEARADQLVEQYAGFSPLEGMTINGRLTLGENIGDLSGLAVAYQAYRRSLDGREAPVLEGLTGDQRFFLGWAQIWRTLYREENLRQRLLTDPHSPAEYRVNGVLRNLPEFYAAFGVEPGDGMYLPPEQRVEIW